MEKDKKKWSLEKIEAFAMQEGYFDPVRLLPYQYNRGPYRIGFPYPGEDEASNNVRQSLIVQWRNYLVSQGFDDPYKSEVANWRDPIERKRWLSEEYARDIEEYRRTRWPRDWQRRIADAWNDPSLDDELPF